MKGDVKEINKLILRISKNDEMALETLFNITKEKMYFIAYEILTNSNYVDDVLSEAYLKIYKNAKYFNPKLNGFNWIYEIVKNTAIDLNRKTKNEKIVKLDESIISNYTSHTYKMDNKVLRSALKSLTQEEQQIIYLKIWERYTLKDIAKRLDKNLTYVHRKYIQSLEKLKSLMDEEYGG
ncbi:MAG: sigma-70 family RNA polymerase sigma factor [Anaeroplasmataceae bacterium]|nr:sigma-70 family RNA polymerase sigma factor [Anaeroplasmataceae bacterium]